MMSCPGRCTLLPAAAVLLVAVLTLQLAAADMPPSANPYAGKSYGGCKGGFCESEDPALELQFWDAASKGDAKLVKQLLSNEKLNLTRNIVPDDDGLSRVLDVAVWVAAEKGCHDVMRVSGGLQELQDSKQCAAGKPSSADTVGTQLSRLLVVCRDQLSVRSQLCRCPALFVSLADQLAVWQDSSAKVFEEGGGVDSTTRNGAVLHFPRACTVMHQNHHPHTACPSTPIHPHYLAAGPVGAPRHSQAVSV
jgi:hypothetical protein